MAISTHQGENIKSIREIRKMKQETLAELMGDDWTQKKISLLEGKESIEPEILEQAAKALNTSVDAIKNYDPEAVVNFITNHFHDNSINNGGGSGSINNCTFNPLDKLMEVIDKNEKLYERLLQAEREKVEMMERLLGKK
ncbi:helix-turn-helix domain-containing protein [Niastella sp. OAS944]|uniref:helix-turn-helix domain-containing protein n=1 Tax=Niastella sp. OAS944 TaxID=2664089 RepID=UPI0035C7A4A1|nr:transcriptional regulator with XRE-family HTH domain [Chitinophagaceae bacterium OAS944]